MENKTDYNSVTVLSLDGHEFYVDTETMFQLPDVSPIQDAIKDRTRGFRGSVTLDAGYALIAKLKAKLALQDVGQRCPYYDYSRHLWTLKYRAIELYGTKGSTLVQELSEIV